MAKVKSSWGPGDGGVRPIHPPAGCASFVSFAPQFPYKCSEWWDSILTPSSTNNSPQAMETGRLPEGEKRQTRRT